MGKYVDGFVLVVPKDKAEEYKKMAQEGAEVWMKHGALAYYECKGDDLAPKPMDENMKPLAFPAMANAKPDEDVWFSFVVFPSREKRDEVNKKVMDEMSEKYKDQTNVSMPFDVSRMAYGGFTVAVEA